MLSALSAALARSDTLSTSAFLILFVELMSEPTPAQLESLWQTAPSWPLHFGLVVSGAPRGLSPKVGAVVLEVTLPPDTDQPVDLFQPSGFSRDVPTNHDDIGIGSYADALARFLLHPQTSPPLTVGVQGVWGKGKSSFMELVEDHLVDNVLERLAPKESAKLKRLLAEADQAILAQQDQAARALDEPTVAEKWQLVQEIEYRRRIRDAQRRMAYDNIVTVWFNAWQYEDATQIWAGLASAISRSIEGALSGGQQAQLRIVNAWERVRGQFVLNIILVILVTLLVIWAYLAFGADRFMSLATSATAAESLPTLFFPAGTLLVFGLCLAVWRLLKVAQPVSARVLSYSQLPDYREQMGYQHVVMHDLAHVYRYLQQCRPGCRAVVFIDDLDRCSDDKVIDVLQAINLILGGYNDTGGQFFVVLGMDTEMIYRAIRAHYKEQIAQDGELATTFPESYLRKIVQLSFVLPDVAADQRFSYVKTLFSKKANDAFSKGTSGEEQSGPAQTSGDFRFDLSRVQQASQPSGNARPQDVQDTADELRALHEYEDFLADNPREMKRLVNVHRLIKVILQRQTIGWDTERERKLVKWLIFCAKWPDLVDDALRIAEGTNPPADCLATVAANLPAQRARDRVQLEAFAGRKDVLYSSDLKDDFARAARISQLVRDDAAPPTDPS
jgi:hypothetical protein